MNDGDNIHEQLTKAGVELDHHSSDLYAKKTPVSERILRNYEHRDNVRTFRNQKDGSIWFDIPFAYIPFWDKVRSRASAAAEIVKIAKSLIGAIGTRAIIEGMNDGIGGTIVKWASKNLEREMKSYIGSFHVERIIEGTNDIQIEASVDSQPYECIISIKSKKA